MKAQKITPTTDWTDKNPSTPKPKMPTCGVKGNGQEPRNGRYWGQLNSGRFRFGGFARRSTSRSRT